MADVNNISDPFIKNNDKTYTRYEKWFDNRHKQLIHCETCGKGEMVHKHSHCWIYELCIVCANRDLDDSEVLGRE